MGKWAWCIPALICAALIAAPVPAYAQDGGADEDLPDGNPAAHESALPGSGGEGDEADGIRLYLDGTEIFLTDPIQNRQGRTYLPLRSFCELLGAEVVWRQDLNSVSVIRGRKEAVFGVNSGFYTVNGLVNHMADATLYLDDAINRAYIPIRYGAETFGFVAEWVDEGEPGRVYVHSTAASSGEITDNEISIAGKMVWLGQTEDELTQSMGYPNRIDESAYGLQWFIYNRNYKEFIMVGVKNRRVAGFFCNCASMGLKDELGWGAGKQDVEAAGFSKETMDFWYDPFAEDRLYAVFCMADYPGAAEQQAAFDLNQELLLRAYEMECFDVTNAFRLANAQPEVLYSTYAAKVALAYAKEMADGNFLDHFSPDGRNPMDRFEAQGIYAAVVLENLAGGYGDAMHAFRGWVESESHRQGMLEENQYLGVGAYYKQASRYRYYFVQEFYSMS
ncbi:MAG: CAP-associated domain-containing protein [Clostridiales bacterium]|nr:CAP-associated domain-containing protein [Clostridiales bacterium]